MRNRQNRRPQEGVETCDDQMREQSLIERNKVVATREA